MAKKKEEKKESLESAEPAASAKEVAELKAKLAEHQAAIEGFRQSFANFDTKFKNLMERNRLR